MDVTLVTVVGQHHPMLSALLNHYKRLGVTNVKLYAHSPDSDASHIADIQNIASGSGLPTTVTPVISPWHYTLNTGLYAISRSPTPNGWFVVADQDEFHDYPDSLEKLVDYCEGHGYDFVEGCFVDRLAEDGTLPDCDPTRSIWAQYPIGAFLSGRLLGTPINKIVLGRGRVILSHGQHYSVSPNGCPPNAMYVPVHHFKWVGGVLDTLKRRVAVGGFVAKECHRFLAHFSEHGRIDLTDPSMLFGRCDPRYPFWHRLLEYRLAAPCFSPVTISRSS